MRVGQTERQGGASQECIQTFGCETSASILQHRSCLQPGFRSTELLLALAVISGETAVVYLVHCIRSAVVAICVQLAMVLVLEFFDDLAQIGTEHYSVCTFSSGRYVWPSRGGSRNV
jgi:hypothetical protein